MKGGDNPCIAIHLGICPFIGVDLEFIDKAFVVGLVWSTDEEVVAICWAEADKAGQIPHLPPCLHAEEQE